MTTRRILDVTVGALIASLGLLLGIQVAPEIAQLAQLVAGAFCR